MYSGVKSHQCLPRVRSYADAQRALEVHDRLPERVLRSPRTITSVRTVGDGGIAFRLYQTDVVIWNADGSVTIDNYGSLTTGLFAAHFLPGGISLNHPTRNGGNCGINYMTAPRSDDDDWRAYWSSQHICCGSDVRFVDQGDHWAPDESTLDEMRFIELDSKGSRELAKRFHLKDLRDWLEVAPAHLELVHEGTNIQACMDALETRNFRRAACLLPTVTIPNGWGAADRIKALPILGVHHDRPVTLGSVDKLRLGMLHELGLTNDVAYRTMPTKAYRRLTAQLARLESMGVNTYSYGARS